jgi:FkbM family methyltransferase
MDRIVEAVRWFNHACPWNQLKPSLGKWAGRRLDQACGPLVYGGVQGQFRMRLDVGDDYERTVYLNCNNMVLVQLLRRILAPGDVYLDAGASLGLLALVAARCVGPSGRVYAFEPQPRALQRLKESVELNRAENVVVVPKGCWDSAGTASFFDFAESGMDLSSMCRRPDREVATETIVETVRIDDVVTPPVKAFKLDVEGAELAALRGAERLFSSDPPPHLLLELNQKTAKAFGYHPLDLVDWVLERSPGYRLHLLKTRRILPVDRAGVVRLLEESFTKNRNLWFEPVRA